MRSAGCCLNDVADREFDRHVKRTAQRPVTAGRIGVKEALAVGAVLALAAFALVLTTNAAAIAWSFAALAIAVLYPYAKRVVSMPQAVLGVAFSFGIPMAFAAVQARVPPLAWVLLLGNLFWVLAYDTEYAMVDRDDDLRIGIKTSAITLGRADVAVMMVFYGAFLAIWLLALAPRALGWPFHLGIAAAAGAGRVALAADPRAHARRLLPGLPPEPLGGLRGVRRHRRRLRAQVAPESVAAELVAQLGRAPAGGMHGLDEVLGHPGLLHGRERRVGGAALGGDPLAQHLRRLGGRRGPVRRRRRRCRSPVAAPGPAAGPSRCRPGPSPR